jgi:hypothetical protein
MPWRRALFESAAPMINHLVMRKIFVTRLIQSGRCAGA